MITGDVLDDLGEETAARLRADGLDVTYRHLDVTVAGRLARRRRRNGVDVLVNNAGIIHVNPLVEETLEAWNRLLAVNATGTLLGMQAAIPAMRAAGGGSIINVATIFGVTGSEGYIAYTASKARDPRHDQDRRARARGRRHPRERDLPRRRLHPDERGRARGRRRAA